MNTLPHLPACGMKGSLAGTGRFLPKLTAGPVHSAPGGFSDFDPSRHILVPLAGGYFVCADLSDRDVVMSRKWQPFFSSASRHNVYAKGKVGGRSVYLHRLLMGATEGQIVDHINRNTLDCRRSNLRFVERWQNNANSRKRKSDTGLRGVSRYKGRFRAYFRGAYLGSFVSPVDAAIAYDKVARAALGEWANLNFPEGLPHAP